MPVKPADAPSPPKSRLVAPTGVEHSALAEAFALDTVQAACAAVGIGHVYAVTTGARLRRQLSGLGARVVTDPGRGLDAAVRAGLAAVLAEPNDTGQVGVGVLLGDLPALTAAELGAALVAAAGHPRAFVPDHQGTGTVLLTARLDAPTRPEAGAASGWGADPVAALIDPAFGPGSAARHEAGGHQRIAAALPGLRTDVDDAAALAEALRLGVGRHTAAALRP